MKIERTKSGELAHPLSKDPDDFRRLAVQVRVTLGGEWSWQLDHHDQSYWDLECFGTTITVHREQYLGVFVCCGDNPTNRKLLERLLSDFDTMLQATEG